MKKQSLITSLQELKEGNELFIETSLSQLYQVFSALYTSMSQVFSSEIPESILSLKQPLIENQPDKVTHINLAAGSTHDHSISMTVSLYCIHLMYRKVVMWNGYSLVMIQLSVFLLSSHLLLQRKVWWLKRNIKWREMVDMTCTGFDSDDNW